MVSKLEPGDSTDFNVQSRGDGVSGCIAFDLYLGNKRYEEKKLVVFFCNPLAGRNGASAGFFDRSEELDKLYDTFEPSRFRDYDYKAIESKQSYSMPNESKLKIYTDFSSGNINEITYQLLEPEIKLPTVFISYNHADREVAEKLKTVLKENHIDVMIDSEAMKAGENISDFIERSINDSDVTLSVVSNKSLLSAWVSMETVNTFYHEKSNPDKKFIACYIDDDFFQNDFRLEATKQIDARISEIDQKIPEYMKMKIDTNDLNSEKTRLYKLRSHLGDFILRLRESLTLDIREDQFDGNIARIISAIQDRD